MHTEEAVKEAVVDAAEESVEGATDGNVDELGLQPQSAPELGGDSPTPVPPILPGVAHRSSASS